ncbi:ImmA/IrrE family metallo-endopeptidase [Nocardia cyriacigeorgica]|uniref:ImmA/IrrE family metallo-endopeptidase n=1 Tax=Nocardia cyriacigeorgica TaxID=135487 RepID=A0A5R8PCP9_9NOCA|nr:ImmA/IrrE family metallo-endopeptidase [Nocardia cyriacigeorgica]
MALKRSDIEKLATELLTSHDISDESGTPPIPVERIAQACGIEVVRSAADWNQSGFLLRDTHRAIIGINSRNAAVRQRFTIAHELGHWQLHTLDQSNSLFVDQSVVIHNRDDLASAGTDAQEIEANAFAAALLMPKQIVRREARNLLNAAPATREEFISSLARIFDVSAEAMSIRLSNLGILRN